MNCGLHSKLCQRILVLNDPGCPMSKACKIPILVDVRSHWGLLIHSLNKHLLNVYFMSDTVIDIGYIIGEDRKEQFLFSLNVKGNINQIIIIVIK